MRDLIGLNDIQIVVSLDLQLSQYTNTNSSKLKTREGSHSFTGKTVPNWLHSLARRAGIRVKLHKHLLYPSFPQLSPTVILNILLEIGVLTARHHNICTASFLASSLHQKPGY